MLSYLSPFRSTRKVKQPTPEPEPEESDEGEVEPLEAEQGDDDDEEQGQFALHGQSLAHVGENAYGEHELEGRAPPSPTPHTYSTANLYPNLNLAASLSASQSLPDLSFANSTPRFSSNHAAVPSPLGRAATPSAYADSEVGIARSPPGRATEELARFFRDKADRGDEPLSAIEQAGVFALMQQAQAESLPTAFTPRFDGRGSPAPAQNSLSHSTSHSALSASTSTQRFGSPAPGSAPTSAFRRRRPIYVGAGYSSQSARRRKATAAAGEGGLSRSQSVGSVYELSEEPPVADGKRRKVAEVEEDAPPPFAADRDAPPSPVKEVAPSSTSKTSALSAPKFSVVSTPARPSPLWQVSQADTPSPSPPKKSTATAPAKPPTRAADIMMDIIREEDATRPKVTRQEVLNPYESADNPMARIPRSRPARPATPRRTPAPAKKAAAPTPAKEISPLEHLERTMPAEYRRDDGKRARPTAPSPVKSAPAPVAAPAPKKAPAPTPAPAPKKQAALETIELSDSDEAEEEQEEDEEMQYEEDEEEADEEDEEEEVPPPAPAPKASAHKSRGSTQSSSTFASTSTSKAPTPTSAFSFTPSPAPPTPKRPGLSAPSSEQPSSPKASLPPTPPPSAPFTFSVPPAAAASTSTADLSSAEARDQALNKEKKALPSFGFAGVFVGCKSAEVDGEEAVRELVKGMSRSELPTLAL